MKFFFVFVLVAVLVLGCTSSPNPKYIEPEIELKPSEVQELLDSILVRPEPTIVPEPTSTPEPTITPPPLVDSRTIVIEELLVFNGLNNAIVTLVNDTQAISKLEGNVYHKMYLSTVMAIRGLSVYESGLMAWKPMQNDYSRELNEIKLSELYRIDKFMEFGDGMLVALLDNDEEAVNRYTEMFNEWGVHPDNKKPMVLQKQLLQLLDITSKEVNFLYRIPDEILEEEAPSLLEKPNARM